MQAYSVEDYVTDIRAIVAEESSQAAITERIKPLALRLCSDPHWVTDAHRSIDADQGFGVHLLHEEDNHDLAVFVLAWAPGRGLAAHNHKTWAVVAPIDGEEYETSYRRLDDGSRAGFADLEVSHQETLKPGTVSCCMPEDIHSVHNTGSEVGIALHTYGRHLNHTGRSIFDVEAKTETPCIVAVKE